MERHVVTMSVLQSGFSPVHSAVIVRLFGRKSKACCAEEYWAKFPWADHVVALNQIIHPQTYPSVKIQYIPKPTCVKKKHSSYLKIGSKALLEVLFLFCFLFWDYEFLSKCSMFCKLIKNCFRLYSVWVGGGEK